MVAERPRVRLAQDQANLSGLCQQLEAWLPAEEAWLMAARRNGWPLEQRERDWQRLLALYERLVAALSR